MGLGRLAYPLSGPPRSPLSRVDSSHLLEFMSFMIAPLWTSLSWRYLRGKDRIENPSLNLHLLCLIPKYLDLIFVGLVLWALLEDGCLEMNKVRAIYKPRKPPVEGEAEPPRKWARPAGSWPRLSGLPSFGPASVSSFACRLLASSRVYVLHDCTPLDVVILEISSRK